MVFKDVIDNFIAQLYFNQCDGWDYIKVDLTILETTGTEYLVCDSTRREFDECVFDSQNWLEGWPAGCYDNYLILPNRLELKPRDDYGRYVVECVLISPWLTTETEMLDECMNDLKRKDVLLYNDVKTLIDDQRLPFL